MLRLVRRLIRVLGSDFSEPELRDASKTVGDYAGDELVGKQLNRLKKRLIDHGHNQWYG